MFETRRMARRSWQGRSEGAGLWHVTERGRRHGRRDAGWAGRNLREVALVDRIGVRGVGGVGGVGQSMADEQIKRKKELTPAVESALGKITGENFKDLRAANDWWRKNKGTFKDPE